MQNVNLDIKEGEIYGLIGPNGAGKTTVFNLLAGVYRPTTGRFFLDGEDLSGKSSAEINRRGIARTFQNIPRSKSFGCVATARAISSFLCFP